MRLHKRNSASPAEDTPLAHEDYAQDIDRLGSPPYRRAIQAWLGRVPTPKREKMEVVGSATPARFRQEMEFVTGTHKLDLEIPQLAMEPEQRHDALLDLEDD